MQLRDLPDSVLEATFFNGLRPDIQAELRQWSPRGLEQKMIIAQCIEDKLLAFGFYKPEYTYKWPKTSPSGTHFSNRNTHILTNPITKPSYSSLSHQAPAASSPSATSQSNPTHTPYKRLTAKEEQERRSKGLCFRCDEMYSPAHR